MTGLQELASRAVLGRRRSKNPVVGALASGFHGGAWLAGVGDVESAPDLGECGLL